MAASWQSAGRSVPGACTFSESSLEYHLRSLPRPLAPLRARWVLRACVAPRRPLLARSMRTSPSPVSPVKTSKKAPRSDLPSLPSHTCTRWAQLSSHTGSMDGDFGRLGTKWAPQSHNARANVPCSLRNNVCDASAAGPRARPAMQEIPTCHQGDQVSHRRLISSLSLHVTAHPLVAGDSMHRPATGIHGMHAGLYEGALRADAVCGYSGRCGGRTTSARFSTGERLTWWRHSPPQWCEMRGWSLWWGLPCRHWACGRYQEKKQARSDHLYCPRVEPGH